MTVAFKSNEFFQKSQDDEEMEGTEKPVSAQEKAIEKLMGHLFKYARKFAEKKEQEQISVAVVGYTNVGKSSLINCLRNKVIVQTSSNAFLTRAMKVVRLNKNVNLIDTPSILVQGIHTKEGAKPNGEDESQQMRILRSAL